MITYFNKIKDLYFQLRGLNANVNELLWANYYHDYTKNIEELKDIKLSPGRWAANYSMLYLLTKIISEYKPPSILELGLGESSKLISALIRNNQDIKAHIILENDSEWYNYFISNYQLCPKSIVNICDIKMFEVDKQFTKIYDIPDEIQAMKFELYIVDGPRGSERYSRMNICHLAGNFEAEKEFIIIIDDAHRKGEKETIKVIHQILKEKQIKCTTNEYKGEKTQYVFATEKYKFAATF